MLNRDFGARKTRRQEKFTQLADEWFPLPPSTPGWWDQRLAAEGIWVDLVHLKAHLIRPKKEYLKKRATG
jgi:hypothetical protein